jgi:hypothetical protein
VCYLWLQEQAKEEGKEEKEVNQRVRFNVFGLDLTVQPFCFVPKMRPSYTETSLNKPQQNSTSGQLNSLTIKALVL